MQITQKTSDEMKTQRHIQKKKTIQRFPNPNKELTIQNWSIPRSERMRGKNVVG